MIIMNYICESFNGQLPVKFDFIQILKLISCRMEQQRVNALNPGSLLNTGNWHLLRMMGRFTAYVYYLVQLRNLVHFLNLVYLAQLYITFLCIYYIAIAYQIWDKCTKFQKFTKYRKLAPLKNDGPLCGLCPLFSTTPEFITLPEFSAFSLYITFYMYILKCNCILDMG